MKKILILLTLTFLYSCSSLKARQNIIPYLFDIQTEKSIYDNIFSFKNDGTVGFYLEYLQDSTYKIHLFKGIDKKLEITNRKLFVNDRFYPLIFDTDYIFHIDTKDNYPIVSSEEKLNEEKTIKIPTIIERKKNLDLYGYGKKLLIIDNSVYWIIDKKGKLLETNSKVSGNIK
jgi:hypothetical protein